MFYPPIRIQNRLNDAFEVLPYQVEFQGLVMDTLTKTYTRDGEEDKQTVGRTFVDKNLKMKKIASLFLSLLRACDYEKPMLK